MRAESDGSRRVWALNDQVRTRRACDERRTAATTWRESARGLPFTEALILTCDFE